MATPQSTIYICQGVRLNHDYQHTIWFDSVADQMAYFAGKVVKTFLGYTFLRKSWSIKVDATLDEARQWSYLYFRNAGKHWYYFINNVEYLNDSTVELFIEMDVMQSYLFDHHPMQCFVEREHSATDNIGDNLLDEGLELGEFMTINSAEVDLNNWYVMILSTANPGLAPETEELVPEYGKSIGNVFSGLGLYAVPLGEAAELGTLLNRIDARGHTDCIISMWMYPEELFVKGTPSASVVYPVETSNSIFHPVARLPYLHGQYIPRNKKLLCYPYNFIYVTNNNGGAATYPYEYFGDPAVCNFKVVGSMSPEGSVRIYPLNFKNLQHGFEMGLNLGAYPSCAWNSDTYKLWLAQNQHQQDLSFAMSGIKIIGGAAAALAGGPVLGGMGAGAAISGFTEIASNLAQRADKEVQPPQSRGSFSSTVNMGAGFQTFTVRRQSIDTAHAEMIDDFFDMYGYKTSRVKIPNRNVRQRWTYTKTIGCSIRGDFCAEDKSKIESIYNNGVTFWKDGDNIGNYEWSNDCL